MLQDKIINMALGTADPLISADRSRCVRMRFNKNACSICTASCRSGAISIDGGIVVDAGKCTECMLCLSECPSGCFIAADEDFFVLLSKLRKTQNSVPRPVLGCKKANGTEAHEKTGCLGFLSEEHLIALAAFLEKPLHINLTTCSQCENFFIIERLKERVKSAKAKTGIGIHDRIVLVENKSDLVYEDISYDRRNFFKTLKNMTFMQVSGLVDEKETEIIRSYSAKKIPLKRDLLNAIIKQLSSGDAAAGILENYAFTIKAGSSCTNCFACIGMCPTGALKIKKDGEGTGLLFNSSLCNGCALCRDFCPAEAVSLSKGFFGSSFFDYGICNPDVYASHAAAGQERGMSIEGAVYQGR